MVFPPPFFFFQISERINIKSIALKFFTKSLNSIGIEDVIQTNIQPVVPPDLQIILLQNEHSMNMHVFKGITIPELPPL